MLRIAITGGIGSGKTTVAKIFETLGIPVYYADNASKELMQNDEGLKMEIKKHFGEQSYHDGLPNRKYLAEIVFNNEDKLALLNSIIHPATIQYANNWMQMQQAPYIIKESALLFESGAQAYVDHVVGVFAPKHIRLKRTMDRDAIKKEEVESRMHRQMDEDIKMKLCDDVVYNNENLLLIPQVLALHHQFLHKNG